MLTRRCWLQAGFSSTLGFGLASLPAFANNPTRPRKAKSIVFVFLTGAASHVDTLDPKPDAPPEVKGEFKAINTRTPGLILGEHLPRLAARSDRYAVVRSMAHRENNHLVATHHVLTGHQQPGAFFDKIASRDDWPDYAATLDHLRPRNDGVPSGVNLPTYLMEGPLLWPGQHAGFLGPKHDPWQVRSDPNKPGFRFDGLTLAPGLEVSRLNDRRSLLTRMDAQRAAMAKAAEGRRLTEQQDLAFKVLTSSKVAPAFDLDREPAAVRDRYGRHTFGQSLLLARRLVESGVGVVQANMGIVQNWDTHGNNFSRLKNELLPPLDRGVSALLDDLALRGLLDETLVIVMGEFGRTPKIVGNGRDHWAQCFSGLFAGAGVKGGCVIGRSDKIGAFPATTPYTPDDFGATVYNALGIDPESELRDKQDRPVQLNRGRVMTALYDGRE
jgi:uncharacterized protein (DUF1501 family)